MVCKQCGTESREAFCPRCGKPLCGEASAISEPTVVSSTEKVRVRPSRKQPLRFGMIFRQSLALLLPLAYLFFDALSVLSDQLFLNSVSGSVNIFCLMERLSAVLYAGNSVSEITEATLGEAAPVWQGVSFASLLTGDAFSITFWLPLAITALMILLCVVCFFFLLLTGGRILRVRLFTDLMLLGGTGAVFAPLLGTFALRLSYYFGHGLANADIMMRRILPSFEYLCIMGILACALLPALSSLKSVSAYAGNQNKFLPTPFCGLEKRSFRFKKTLSLLSVLSAIVVLVCFFYLPVTTSGSLKVFTLKDDWGACYRALIAVKNALDVGNGSAVNFLSAAESLLNTALSLSTVVLLLFCVPLLLTVWRLFTLRTGETARKKGAKRILEKTGKSVRNAILAPYAVFAVVQMAAVLFLLFFTPVVSHLNFSDIEQTLSVLYLTVAYVRAAGGTETLYALMAACGTLLWHVAGESADAVLLTEKKSLSQG